ncbi:MAG: MarR family transcriptional regulator [Frankiales bacterium]|nr:MarR family transcriptional regulator [Frankiales bacterium]
MTAPRFDTVVHAPLRLQVCAMLAAVDSAEFAAVRDELGVSDSVLSKHVKVLDEAGYLRIRKAVVASRQRTWLGLTAAGRRALAGHVAELQRLLDPIPDTVRQP